MLNAYHRTRLLLLCGIIVSYVLFFYSGRLFGIPNQPHFEMSLMQQANPAIDFIVIAVVFMASVLLGTLIAGTIRFDAGLFVASLGLIALSIRGGPMHCVLQSSTSPRIYPLLAAELAMLYILAAIAWWILWLLHRRGLLKPDVVRDGMPDQEHSLGEHFTASAVQIAVMLLAMLFFAQSDAKFQVLAAVGVSAFAGAAVAHSLFPVRPSIWFWIGPLVVGTVGYLWAYANPDGWIIGQSYGLLSPLTRALPLDYAGGGVAGAVLGYWMSRRWARDRNAAAEETAA